MHPYIHNMRTLLVPTISYTNSQSHNALEMKGTKVPNLAAVSKLFVNAMPA